MSRSPGGLAAALLAWHARAGRHDLPWQREPTPYRVWVSEVMLQQTRVDTVIGYFERFCARFPEPPALAAAPLDAVLHLWSGLGYYARARNLHRAARLVCERHGGELPAGLEALQALPGIGRSTAAAILALARGERHAILDGNARRVLARYHAIEGWPGQAALGRELWRLAERHTPERRVAAYTQAIMDLGATVCTRTGPRCAECPLAGRCAARAAGRQAEIPAPRPRRALPLRRARALVVRDRRGRLLLERRPPAGLWGGLWSFPECPPEADPAAWAREHLGLAVRAPGRPLAALRHTFSHYRLALEPWLLELEVGRRVAARVAEPEALRWHRPGSAASIGLAAPVARVVRALTGAGRG